MVEGVPTGIMNTYCWIHSTFTVVGKGEEKKYHKYYQWVCFFLFLQAMLFYIPRYLWKTSEGGKIKMLVQGARGELLFVLLAS